MVIYQESLARLSAATLEESPAVGFQFYGVATNVVGPGHFYIVPLRCYNLMYILESPGQIEENICMSSIVSYLSPKLGRHVRGEVQLMSPGYECVMYAMDYGITDMWVEPSDIFTLLHPEAGLIPPLAHLCHLSLCYPRQSIFTQDDIEGFKFFMGEEGEKLAVTVTENDSYSLGVLVMSSQSNPDDISTVMSVCNFSVFSPEGHSVGDLINQSY